MYCNQTFCYHSLEILFSPARLDLTDDVQNMSHMHVHSKFHAMRHSQVLYRAAVKICLNWNLCTAFMQVGYQNRSKDYFWLHKLKLKSLLGRFVD